MPDPLPIAIAVVESHGRFLIGRRPDGVPLAGLWEFPGGKVRGDESPAAAAVRECFEESGLEVRVDRPYAPFTHEYDYGSVQLHFFACTPLADTAPRPPFRWVARDDLANYEFPAANAALLRELLRESRPG